MSKPFPNDPTTSSTAAKAPRSAAPSASGTGHPPWLTLAALAISVVAVGLAIVGWFRPSTGPGKFSDQQTQEAKTHICEATGTVRQATGMNTNMPNPIPGDPIGGLAVAANARLALFGGGSYLLQRLHAEPATPATLGDAVAAMAHTMQDLSINYLAGAAADSPVQQPLRDNLTSQLSELDGLCQ